MLNDPHDARDRARLATLACIGFSLVAILLLAVDVGGILVDHIRAGEWRHAAIQLTFVAILAILMYGNLVYQLARLGHVVRQREHSDESLALGAPQISAGALSVLVPSYCEEYDVLRRTLLSAALLDHPHRRVVLLIDDPPAPASDEEKSALEATRSLPQAVARLLEEPAGRFEAERRAFELRAASGQLDLPGEAERLSKRYEEAALWLVSLAEEEPLDDHEHRCFVQIVLRDGASHLLSRAEQLRQGVVGGEEEIARDYAYLAGRFRVELESFERKRYVNLSHTPNKAMNLNAYLGLLGGRFVEVEGRDGLHLVPAEGSPGATHVFPGADYVITLDADSVLRFDYARRLIDFMEQPEHARVAVVQTPYSAFPGAIAELERIAGATTDIQYNIHQGFTRFGATYWVGANALIRIEALRELRTSAEERGFRVEKFISDETVIEDTESSVDLVARGWRLHNYPERMAFSATPPDFGSLAIQRSRWANGGLLILPKLLGYLRARIASLEAFMRCHYLVSIAGVNLGLVVLLLVPFDQAQMSWWLPVAAAPYFALYSLDLRAAGYRASDVLRVYALNLLLIPVNLEGVAGSLWQAATGRKAAFRRTPKVESRTPTERRHLGFHLALLLGMAGVLAADLAQGLWVHASFVAINGGLLAYGLLHLLGPAAIAQDLRQ